MEAPCFSILYYFQMKMRKQMAQVNLEIVLVQNSFVMYAKSKRLQQKQAAYFPQIPRTSPPNASVQHRTFLPTLHQGIPNPINGRQNT